MRGSDIYSVVGSNVDQDGFLELQPDGFGEQDSGLPPFEAHHPLGLWSCPADPAVDPSTSQPLPAQACNALIMREGGRGHAIPLEDPRAIASLPIGVAGETILYHAGGAGHFVRFYNDGSIAIVTSDKGGGPQGQSVASWTRPDGFERSGPWGIERMDALGFRWDHASGASIHMRYIGGLPAPLASGSVIDITAQNVNLVGSVAIGPNGVDAQPVAQVPALMTYVTAVGALAAAVGALVASLTPASGVTSAQIAAVTGAITALEALSGGLAEAMATQTALG